ncbi:MAG: Fe-Mn family superoxide dismutase [Opitutaceae bacterium]
MAELWEHTHYLKNRNLRPRHVEVFWNVVDWNTAEENYKSAKA